MLASFVHITDLHVDPLYSPFAPPSANCHLHPPSFVTSAPNSTVAFAPTSSESAAVKSSPYGILDSGCDSPLRLVQETLDHLGDLRKSAAPDSDSAFRFVLWTGDSSRHDRDSRIRKQASEVYNQNAIAVSMFLNAFNTNDIPVIPTIGNWDVFPVSSLAAAPNDPQLVSLWSVWEPLFIGGMDIIEFEETKSTFLHGGYFSRTVLDGLISVISINTLLFFNENPLASACAAFNLLPHSERPFDPANPPDAHQIWLENQLLLARQADRRVILQGHVSPQGSDGVPVYTDACYQWVIYFLGEYSDVIISSYFGHINKDLIQLVWQPYPLSADKEKNPAENPANPYRLTTVLPNHGGITQDRHVLSSLFTGASVIPTSSPAFRIGTLSITRADGGDSAVVRLARHQTHAADLNAANGRGGGLMYRPCGCDTRTDFGLRLLGPSDLQEWSARVESGKGGAAAKAAKKYARCIAATALTSGDAASELRSGGGGKGWGAWMLAEVGVGVSLVVVAVVAMLIKGVGRGRQWRQCTQPLHESTRLLA